MREVIEKMLEIERRARRIVAKAEARSLQLTDEARQQARQVAEAARQEALVQVEPLVQEALAQAEKTKQARLAEVGESFQAQRDHCIERAPEVASKLLPILLGTTSELETPDPGPPPADPSPATDASP